MWGGVLIALPVLGVFHLRGATYAAARWVIAWVVAVVADVMLEVANVLGSP